MLLKNNIILSPFLQNEIVVSNIIIQCKKIHEKHVVKYTKKNFLDGKTKMQKLKTWCKIRKKETWEVICEIIISDKICH